MKRYGLFVRASSTLLAMVSFVLMADLMAQRTVQPGDPLPGLSPTESEQFLAGREDFLEVEDAEEGLGPAYKTQPQINADQRKTTPN